ncbi:Protein of unknown function [Carnobacterium iners]|uniref:DUF2877 domain-containing protein n=1 Tax=Carnobacterium iners TaxID=1073423 RepID=A0A1X7NAU8_9LACT|nr:DUF2877 domain-containing protein [Carnobacterium iners]SEK52163.1 Protein of unknown function [Carnobacterium iners]SMH34717.1 Protein of unknown function [Carnobacterium iners]
MIFIQKMSKQLKEQMQPDQDKLTSWKVHSIFKNGFNLMSGKQLLFIGTDKNGELPFSLHLTARDTKVILKEISIGDTFHYDYEKKVMTIHQLVLSFDYCYVYDSILPLQQKISLNQIDSTLEEAEKILELNGFKKQLPLFFTTIDYDESFMKSIEGLFSNEEKTLKESMLYFIGRGMGLTPSGDDLLVGLLSIDSGYPLLDERFRSIIIELLETKSLTTIVAETYLRYAAQHKYSTTIVSFVGELNENPSGNQLKVDFKTILTNGSTSGLDTMTGMLFGILSEKRRINL